MQCDFLVLGGNGLQGRIVLRYLLKKKYRVLAADAHADYLKTVKFKKTHFTHVVLDIKDRKKLAKLLKDACPSVVVNCAEWGVNLTVYRACLEAGVHVIDLGSDSKTSRAQAAMGRAFEKKRLTAITGCGSTPGINNVMCHYACDGMDEVRAIEVGFAWNANRKEFVVPFSIASILYELTEKATYLKNGAWKKIVPAKSEERRDFGEIGRQSVFLVEHPEVRSLFDQYKKKGVRNISFYAGFPDHTLEVLWPLTNVGFRHGEKPLDFSGQEIMPTSFLAQMLKRNAIPPGYKETEVLWVTVKGKSEGKEKTVRMACWVHSLPEWGGAGSNIDTGIPAAIIAEMIFKNEIARRGSFTPEQVIPPLRFFEKIGKFRMWVTENGQRLN